MQESAGKEGKPPPVVAPARSSSNSRAQRFHASPGPNASSSAAGPLNNPMVAVLRLILAASTLLVTLLAPPPAGQYHAALYVVLSLYMLYSAVLYVLDLRGIRHFAGEIIHYVDILWIAVIVALSGGLSSIYFILFFLYFKTVLCFCEEGCSVCRVPSCVCKVLLWVSLLWVSLVGPVNSRYETIIIRYY